LRIGAEELVSARDFRRNYAEWIRRLQEGEVEKIALTRHGRITAVVVAPSSYQALSDGESR
jgi:antitoxin (DNA-binding transcriptional repressor) of toxin-antitoxin stability system